MKSFNIEPSQREGLTVQRPEWHRVVHRPVSAFENQRNLCTIMCPVLTVVEISRRSRNSAMRTLYPFLP